MSNEDFENYVALMGKLLQFTPEQRDQISGELQDHLQLRVADLLSEGMSKPDAIRLALEEFGDAAVMARNFQSVIKLKRQRWMMRFATYSMAGAVLVAILTMAMWPENSRFGAPNRSLAQADETTTETAPVQEQAFRGSVATQQTLAAEQALKQMADFNYDERPFKEIEEELEAFSGLNFILSASATDDSLAPDEPVTFNLSQVPLGKALNLMLEQYNATYVIDEGVVIIISLDDAEDAKWMRIKMFDCRQLVKKLPETRPPTQSHGGGFGGGGLGGGGGGVFSIPLQGLRAGQDHPPATNDKPTPSTQESSLDDKLEKILTIMQTQAARERPKSSRDYTLLNLVTTIIKPDTWTDTGQGLAQIKVVNGILVVTQTEAILGEIENFIADLEGQLDVIKAVNVKISNAGDPFGAATSAEFNDLSTALNAFDNRNQTPKQNRPKQDRPTKDPFGG